VTVVGVGATWVTDHFWGAAAAGIVATVYFAVFAILFSLLVVWLRAPDDLGGHQPMTDPPNSRHVLESEKFQNDPVIGPAKSGTASFALNDSRQRAEDYPGFGAAIASDDYLDSRNNLVERLARSIPDTEYIAQVASEAGLGREHLRLSGTPSNQWSSLIGRAEEEQRERRVVERASRISPDATLRRAIQDYLRHRP